MITKDMLISDALNQGDVDKISEVFAGFGMHCLRCMLAQGETIEEAAMAHGVNVDDVINELNAVIE